MLFASRWSCCPNLSRSDREARRRASTGVIFLKFVLARRVTHAAASRAWQSESARGARAEPAGSAKGPLTRPRDAARSLSVSVGAYPRTVGPPIASQLLYQLSMLQSTRLCFRHCAAADRKATRVWQTQTPCPPSGPHRRPGISALRTASLDPMIRGFVRPPACPLFAQRSSCVPMSPNPFV